MTTKSCLICGADSTPTNLLVSAPCGTHWVCPDDVTSFFARATADETLFPPKCCEQIFLLHDYEEHLPWETAWGFRVKEQGEYAVGIKFRVYCANAACSAFLHPSTQIKDEDEGVTYAVCESEGCGKMTCVNCKMVLDQGTRGHICQADEIEIKFRQTAMEKGFQECFDCGRVIELAEACNHITCVCGNSFCYICGKAWSGEHGCPSYGPVQYDEDGFNQDGFHRDTGLDRDGLNRMQDNHDDAGEDTDTEDDEEDTNDADDEFRVVMQRLSPELRTMVNGLPPDVRAEALDSLRIQLIEEGIVLGGEERNERQDEELDGEQDRSAQEDDDQDKGFDDNTMRPASLILEDTATLRAIASDDSSSAMPVEEFSTTTPMDIDQPEQMEIGGKEYDEQAHETSEQQLQNELL